MLNQSCSRVLAAAMRAAGPSVLAVMLCAGAASAQTPSFTPLGDLPGDPSFESQAFGLSGDGTVAVGVSDGGNGTEAFRWDGTMSGLGDLSLGVFDSRAAATNADGSIVAGTGTGLSGLEAFLWNTTTSTPTGIGTLDGTGQSNATGLSADGSAVTGGSDSTLGPQAYRWQGGMTPLGDLAGGAFRSQGLGISGDGLTVVGESDSGNGNEAFVWTVGNPVMTPLGDLVDGNFFSRALGVNGDGLLIAGQGESALGREAVLWQNGVIGGLGDLPGGVYDSVAFDVSDTGAVVGSGSTDAGPEAFYWTSTDGMLRVQAVLVSAGLGAQVSGWRLVEARSVSDDGNTLAGWGINPNGDFEGWIATVPEPGTALLFGLGLAGIAAQGRRRQA